MTTQLESQLADDAHHIRAAEGSSLTLCEQDAATVHTLSADTTVWPDGAAACWTCWVRRAIAIDEENGR